MFRRREPLHERLAREGGLVSPERQPHDVTPRWGEAGIHGVPRPRKWDAVVLATAPYEGEWLSFVALPDGTLLTDAGEDVSDEALAPLAAALETSLSPPYRAEAVRRGENRFAVAAQAIEVADVPEEIDGDEVELTVYEGERELRIDGVRTFGSIPSLEGLGGSRSVSYVLRAQRLDEMLWEVWLAPL
jgi:hypothetical protein